MLSIFLRFIIIGATKSVYAPEPFDVGKILQADVNLDDHRITLTTTGPIDPGIHEAYNVINNSCFRCYRCLAIVLHEFVERN